jgi:hypothetical protein
MIVLIEINILKYNFTYISILIITSYFNYYYLLKNLKNLFKNEKANI